MESAHKYLFTPYGPFLYRPSFTSSDSQVGIITRFAPGVKENGAIFVHPVAWATMAWAILKDGEKAMQYHLSVLPNLCYKKNPEKYYSEPYVYAEYIAGPDSEYYGEGSHSWFTGGPPWHYHVFVSYLLGVRADYDGIVFDPCLPKSWKKAEIKRTIRGKKYHIVIIRNNNNKLRIKVNGRLLAKKILQYS